MNIVMPKLGLTMTEGTLTRWLITAGQSVRQGDILFEFESEKSSLEYECPANGVMSSLVVAEGETVPCGTLVALLEPIKVTEPVNLIEETAVSPTGIYATPAAKRRARELNIDIFNLAGRGVNGRVHLIDVESAAEKTVPSTINATPLAKRLATDMNVDLTQVVGHGPGGRITRDDVLTAVDNLQDKLNLPEVGAAEAPRDAEGIFRKRAPVTGVRRVIGQHMSSSALSAPHVTLHTEVDATFFVAARQQLNMELAGQVRISYNALFVACAARALRTFPQVNACLIDDEICTYSAVNVGLAVDTERGLLVPVIRNADRLSIDEIQQIGDTLVQRALLGKNLPDDLSGGTFTITNLGMYGIDAFTPIINQPQAAILGVGRIVNKPVGLNGKLMLRDRITLSLSFDHRILDGAPAARFLQRIGQLVERPFALLVPGVQTPG